ncbi:short chain dehydrogenase [Mesoplasma entomophilum]|uniref:Short chain dehydrogenase n=1 Tax=Mesoplasma entomophilum TaxID=2149 RepID=A0A3S5Y0C0_9MOLU|nr:short chain dehydrogenase [Mesoplasma entomophilum]ATQ35521.1 short chain dehydrogenase [Mesoplasma entomophilum]ATZ19481.1 short chain dehydrogenase [Mesoplasma entomophilum]AVN60370.1 short chain dehydrogenase [Mesoplasma entomophilum]
MKILVLGGCGTLGSAIVSQLKEKDSSYEIITAGRKTGDVHVDMTSEESIEAMFAKIGNVDHIVNAAGSAEMKPMEDLTQDDIKFSINSKLLGQVNMVLIGSKYLNVKGSISLIAGVIKDELIKMGTMYALTNGAIAAFAKAAAFDTKKDIRINCISPSVLDESMVEYAEYFKGVKSVPASKAAKAFIDVIESDVNGQEIKVY